jgi:hypothetical protein
LKEGARASQLDLSAATKTFSTHDNPAFTVAALASSVVKSLTKSFNIASLLDRRTEAGVLGSARARNVHNAVVTASLREGLFVCRSKDDMAAAK